MKTMLYLTALLFFLPSFAFADEAPRDTVFKAEVVEVLREERNVLPDGTEVIQQDLKLKALEGELRGEVVEFYGIGDFDVLSKQIYKEGDKVLLAQSYDAEGNPAYFITDYVRSGVLWALISVFAALLIVAGRLKGLRSLLSLALTFLVIIKFIIPKILAGSNPLVITLIGSVFILLIIIYVTEGFKTRAHISVISIFISLAITILFSRLFVGLSKLTGAGSEDVFFLMNIEGAAINLQGLLLAGIIIGALGVLDDVVISQVAATEEISKANSGLGMADLFKKSYSVGVSHIASMTNTLFLAYAGVSLPLLILFVSGESAFAGWEQAINTELIATEIVRTLSGSIGLILSVPIATFIAAWRYGSK
jgi:uncharacterized membrane protein